MRSMEIWSVISSVFVHVLMVFGGVALILHRQILDYFIKITGLNKILKYDLNPEAKVNTKIHNLISLLGKIVIIYAVISCILYSISILELF